MIRSYLYTHSTCWEWPQGIWFVLDDWLEWSVGVVDLIGPLELGADHVCSMNVAEMLYMSPL